jgi:double-stranded uracil-DNA glycosylase
MPDVLPDLLKPGLRVVFCGTAAVAASARAGAYYAGPGNSFWQTLHATGLTPEQFVPAEYVRLADFGIGLTDICKIRHGSDDKVGNKAFDVPGLEAKIRRSRPRFVAFNGKNAAKGAWQRPVDYGRQPKRLGGVEVWVLPSTSGAARKHWDLKPWRELAHACANLA